MHPTPMQRSDLTMHDDLSEHHERRTPLFVRSLSSCVVAVVTSLQLVWHEESDVKQGFAEALCVGNSITWSLPARKDEYFDPWSGQQWWSASGKEAN